MVLVIIHVAISIEDLALENRTSLLILYKLMITNLTLLW